MDQIEVSALTSDDIEIQSKASLKIYESVNLNEYIKNLDAQTALRDSVAGKNKSAAAILLLGYDSSPEALRLLNDTKENFGGKMAKLQPWTPAVPLSLVANVSLLRIGDLTAKILLLEEIEGESYEALFFLLSVLREIDDPTVLNSISRTLDDARPVKGSVPSGAKPTRRLADVAVEGFIERLGLTVDFKCDPTLRYSLDDIDKVKLLIKRSIPH